MSVKKDLIVYPDERINIPSTDVRTFDGKLAEVIDMMKEVMEENGAEGLAAIQTGYPYNIVLVREGNGDILELINPRILKSKGLISAKERTLYYPGIEIEIPRYETIRLVYEDRFGRQHHMEAAGHLARVLQRKIDYTFGGTFLSKVDKQTRKTVEKNLADNGLVPQTEPSVSTSKRIYFLSFADKILFFMFLTLFGKVLGASPQTLSTLYSLDIIGMIVVFVLMIGYFLYGRYETGKYGGCTSCQIGNMAGSAVKRVLAAAAIGFATYFFVNPTTSIV